MIKHHIISDELLTISDVEEILSKDFKLELGDKSIKDINKCRQFLDDKVQNPDRLYYGINTGFGSLCNVRISETDLEDLQENLVKSHAAGVGQNAPVEIVRLILLLKIQSLSYGYSGVALPTIKRLVDFYNTKNYPQIKSQGSLGASGDLAPLAHMSLPLLGLGRFFDGQNVQSTESINKANKWPKISLKAKEGLALLNGTQFSTSYALHALINARKLIKWANTIAALSIDAFGCQISPFDNRLHQIRKQTGQISIAQSISQLLKGSEIMEKLDKSVQDPYSFRCVPQVHGATLDTIQHAERILTNEINAVTDNPNIFVDDDAILSGGNFHAQPIALVSDFLAIALSELASISERRIYQLISGERNLPAFLTKKPGLNSGLMIAQYTAASVVSQNKQLSTPASVDSIVSCNGQEDHVSMAANGGTKLYQIVENVEKVLAIELMTAAQAIEFRRPLSTSPQLESILSSYRNSVTPLEEDRVISEDIDKTIQFIKKYDI